MLGIFVLLAVGFAVWKFALAGDQFLQGFTRLLSAATIQRGALDFATGRSSATGRYNERDVTIQVQAKRGTHSMGFLVVSMRAARTALLDANGIEARVQDAAGRRALVDIAAEDLTLTVADGWLRATWKPLGLFIFPGRFTEQKWRRVLDALDAVASALERGADPS